MQHSESIQKIAAAMSKAQGQMENADKSSNNPFFGSKYADLAEVINTARAVLAVHGLSVVQFPGYSDGEVTLENVLMHESGEWMSGMSGAPMPVMTKKDGTVLPPSPQGVGSAITYLRRYSLAALCMIAQEDDDGEKARGPAGSEAPKAPARSDAPPPSSQHSAPPVSNVFDMDAKAPGKPAEGKTWRELLETEDGMKYIQWAIDKMAKLDNTGRAALKHALDKKKASIVSPVDEVKALLDKAASLPDCITIEQSAHVEETIAENDPDRLRLAVKWLTDKIAEATAGKP